MVPAGPGDPGAGREVALVGSLGQSESGGEVRTWVLVLVLVLVLLLSRTALTTFDCSSKRVASFFFFLSQSSR